MTTLQQLPRSCTIEKKDFVLSVDNWSRDFKLLITEVGPYKSFSIAVTLESLEWLKSSFRTLLDTPRTTRFFLEKRFEECCLWVQKTYNRKGYIAEIYRVDDRGRKCCILVPEGAEKSGWAHFVSLLHGKKDPSSKTNYRTILNTKMRDGFSSSDSGEDTKRRSYAEAVIKGSSSDEESNSRTENIKKTGKSNTTFSFDWERTAVLTRRYFHDDWERIVEKLNEQLDTTVRYKPFHADKALIYFKNEEQAKLLCKNKGWTTVGRFYVKFEEWSQKTHASPKVIPSYGGWIKVRGVPLHAWNLESFIQIGDACGGFVEVAKETRELTDIFEASIKIKDNYTGFIPAYIKLFDKEEHSFIVQVIVKTEGKWHRERSPSIHGTFTREAAKRFDEFNMNSEQYLFEDNFAVSPEKAVSMVVGKKDNGQNLEKNKKLGAMMDFLNYDGDSDSSEKRKMKANDDEMTVISQKGGKFFYRGENSKSAGQKKGKRKVSFESPKSKTLLYDPKSAPQALMKLKSPLESPKKKLMKKFREEIKGKSKKMYRIKSPNTNPDAQNEKKTKGSGLKIQPINEVKEPNSFSLTVDLGPLSPFSDEFLSSPDQLSISQSPTSPTHSDIIKDSIEQLLVSENEEKSEEEKGEEKTEEENFKEKLIEWLKTNNLKLAPVDWDTNMNPTSNVYMGRSPAGNFEKGNSMFK
ncbi:hypothetical protein E6C27_scaffold366G00060 [Cucumis melo var. makuwa]|uniref:Uncharacterized protein n=1 Tax=Cucumis melo var. makuwa TaxID=1194695 RepID=A0A5A7TFK7_CUCMM|nr:hypothetical protein E6C27_scaffold366G00060 [Cucumis melo var. makuwa]